MTNEELKPKVTVIYEGAYTKGKLGICQESSFNGWLMWQHQDGQWVSLCPPDRLQTRAQSAVDLEAAIHYPECWDTAAYPTVESALAELCAFFKCSNADCAQGHIALAGGASTIPAAINVVLDDLVRADGRDESDFSHGYYTALDEAKSRIAAKLKEMGVE